MDTEPFRRKDGFATERKKERKAIHSVCVTGASLKIFWELMAESSPWYSQCAELSGSYKMLLPWGRTQAVLERLAGPALGNEHRCF